MAMIIKRMGFDIYDLKYEEVWLNEQAKEGLELRKVSCFYKYCFDRTDKKNLRYSVIPKDINEISDEECQLYREAGWQPACGFGDRSFLYTNDPKAEEIFTDDDSYKAYHEKTYKYILSNAFFYLLLALVWFLNAGTALKSGSSDGFQGLVEKTTLNQIAYIVAAFSIVVSFSITGVMNIRRRQEFVSGEMSDSDAEIKRIKILYAVRIALLMAMIAGLLLSYVPGAEKLKKSEALKYSGDHPVLMKEVFPDEWEYIEARVKNPNSEEIISAGDGHGAIGVQMKYNYVCRETSNLFLKEGYLEEALTTESDLIPKDTEDDEEPDEATSKFMDEYEPDGPEYISLYYDFKSEARAIKLLKNEIEHSVDITIDADNDGTSVEVKGRDTIDAIRIDAEGVDYAGFVDERSADSGYAGWQNLYLRKGSKVVCVSYSGEHELLESLDKFIEQFNV